MPPHLSCSARIYSGVVPQQPPTIHAPASAIRPMVDAKALGLRSYVAFPSVPNRGIPAFGFTITGMDERDRSSRNGISICSGPRLQLRPMASAPNPSKSADTQDMSPPVRSLPRSSHVTHAKTGRLQFSFAASTAAFSSCVSPMVSMKIRLAPASAPALTTSAKAETASSKSRSPTGEISLPVGPISSATSPPAH